MASELTVEKIKTNIRIMHNRLDEEIADEIDACLADLRLIGVQNPSEGDVTILNAVKLWCRSRYCDEPADRTEYLQRYEALKSTLKCADGYGGDIIGS